MRSRLAVLFLALLTACGGGSAKSTPDAMSDVAADSSDAVTSADGASDAAETAESGAPVDVDALIEEGRYWLMNGEAYFALQAFEQALVGAPDNTEARFGAGLSQYIHASEILAMLLNMPSQFLGYFAGDLTRAESHNDALAEQLATFFGQIGDRFSRAEMHFSMIDDPDFEWSIERAPLYYVVRPMLIYRGRFDLGDVHLLRAVNGFCRWFTAFLTAQDLETDFAYALVIVQEITEGEISAIGILDAAAALLGDSPGFLTLRDKEGLALFEQGSEDMAFVGRGIRDAVAFMEDESPTDDDVTHLEWDAGERYLVLRNHVTFEGYEGTEQALRIRIDDAILQATEELIEALENPGTVVPFSHGPGLQLATILGIAAKLGIVEQMGIPLPVDITHLEIDQILVLLSGFLPDVLGFDWAGFNQTPAGLRVLLPTLADPDDPETWLLSWECLDDLEHEGFPSGAGGLLCADVELVDSPHFQGTPWEMEPNGHVTKLPYLVWEEPTLGGLIYVDAAWEDGDEPDWQVPDNQLLNTGLHIWLDGIMGLF